jgi:hypothetical protein
METLRQFYLTIAIKSLMRQLTIFLILISTNVFSQKHLGFGQIKADSTFSCIDQLNIIYQEGGTYNGHSTGLKSICQSGNEFEIRLFVAHRPSVSWDLFVITFNNNIWSATKYSFDWGRKSFDTAQPITISDLRPKNGFDSLFSNLKMNHVFTLPDQNVLAQEILVHDGNIYFLTFKADNKFRRFYFEDPDAYKEHFKNIPEFINFGNIVYFFYKELEKE